jgi:hypothetical protein
LGELSLLDFDRKSCESLEPEPEPLKLLVSVKLKALAAVSIDAVSQRLADAIPRMNLEETIENVESFWNFS